MNRIKLFDIQKPTRLNAHYQGNRYETYRIRISDVQARGGISVDEANAYMEKHLRPHLSNTKFAYQVAYELEDGTWVHSYFDDQTLLPDFSNYNLNEDDQTVIYMKVNRVERPTSMGGYDDTHNDCLFNAIKWALADKAVTLKKFPKYPVNFKKWLKIKDDDPIDYKDIPIIEDKIKVNINITGNVENGAIHSTKKWPLSVTVEFFKQKKNGKGHYIFKHNMALRKQ